MSDLRETRQSLLLELGRRSDEAWAEFLTVYEGAIYRMCRSRGLQDADARDATQEVLAAVHARIGDWDPDASKGSFRGWLMRVARNLSIDRVTDRARRTSGSGDSAIERLLHEVPDGPEATEFDLELRRSTFEWAADKVRGQVRDATWQAFRLTALEGLEPADVAARLGVPVGSVYTAKCRVVARIRQEVEALESDA